MLTLKEHKKLIDRIVRENENIERRFINLVKAGYLVESLQPAWFVKTREYFGINRPGDRIGTWSYCSIEKKYVGENE